MPVYLRHLPDDSNRGASQDQGFQTYRETPVVAALGWPDEVVRQWLYNHGQHVWFLKDYGTVDLTKIRWELEEVSTSELAIMQTGPSEANAIAAYAAAHEHYLSSRPKDIQESWEVSGTWIVPPLLISRSLLRPPGQGLQALEGRTRVGILQGRHADGFKVAEQHTAWVGRDKLATPFPQAT